MGEPGLRKGGASLGGLGSRVRWFWTLHTAVGGSHSLLVSQSPLYTARKTRRYA